VAALLLEKIGVVASLNHRVGRLDSLGQCGGQKDQSAFGSITVGNDGDDLMGYNLSND